jgi:uncharacterized alpha-E superfamily protein
LFLNKQNPISILSQLEQLLKFVEQLPQKEKGAHDSEISNIVFECYSLVRLINVEALMAVDKELEFRLELDRVCEVLSSKISLLSTKLTAWYFSHSTYQYQGTKDNFKLEV